MRRALLLLALAGCGKSEPPPPDLSWMKETALLNEWTSAFPMVTRTPVIKGKLLILEMDRKEVLVGMMKQLPAELRPATKAEVGTLAWLRTTKTPVGQYKKMGLAGNRDTLEVTLIDVAAREAFHWHGFDGGMPEKEIRLTKEEMEDARREGGISGTAPKDAVLQYLIGLPRN